MRTCFTRSALSALAPPLALLAASTPALAGDQSVIPVSHDVTGQGTPQIGTLTVDENQPPAGDGRIRAEFVLDPCFAYLDDWYDFRWINVVTGFTVGGVPQASHPLVGDLPAIDPAPLGFGNGDDDKPFYETDAEFNDANGPLGHVEGKRSKWRDARSNGVGPAVITFETYLVAHPITDPVYGPKDFLLLAGFGWTSTVPAGGGQGAEDLTLSIVSPGIAEANRIDDAIGNAEGPGFPGWNAIAGFDLQACNWLQTFWYETFDQYVPNAVIDFLGGWFQWDMASNSDARVTNTVARSCSNSLYTERDADKVQDFNGLFTSGTWEVVTNTFVPSTLVDPQWGVLLSDYSVGCGGAGTCTWTAQYMFDPSLAQIVVQTSASACTGALQLNLTAPLLFDEWNQVRLLVDLTGDRAQVYVNNLAVGDPFHWSDGFGNGPGTSPLSIDTLDLYANNNLISGDRVYWDDLRVTPAPNLQVPGCGGTATTFCTAGISSSGCVPAINATGIPSASASSGFTIGCSGVEANKSGLLFYGFTDTSFVPFAWGPGSTSFMCMRPPVQRTPVQSSGGLSPCTGAFSLDWNAFMSANPIALGNPRVAGQSFDAQYWYRDPPAPKTTNLSDAVRLVLAP